MKTLFALVLGCYIFAGSECVEVKGPEVKPSSQDARITVLLDGKPRGNVKVAVTIFPTGPVKAKPTDTLLEVEGSRSLVTDSQGTVVLKDLPVGTAWIKAADEDYFQADLILAVSKHQGNDISSFSLTLVNTLPALPALSNAWAAEKNAVPERLRQLDLVVLDAAGGLLPHAEIRVYKRESYPENLVTKARTDENGRFALSLNPGAYAVTIRMPRFKAALRVIEVSPEGRDGELREVLELGVCSETVFVTSMNSK